MSAMAGLALAATAVPFDLPPMPRPEEGYLALWDWLRAVNGLLSIPDAEFRFMFGAVSIPILLLFEAVGIRKDWKLYPFLLPFWLIFGGVSLGVVGGLAAAAAHVVLFPIGRTAYMLRDRRRRREAREAREAPGARVPAHAPVHTPEATGERPARPELSAFRPDMSRFRRRPPTG